MEGERPGAWRAWVNVVREALENHDCGGPERERRNEEDDSCFFMSELAADIGHALEWHLENGQRWRNSNWTGLIRQAEQWIEQSLAWDDEEVAEYLEEALGGPDRRPAPRTDLSWTSLLGEKEVAGFTLNPLTTGWELRDIGHIMANCLGTYGERCASGEVRIFTLHRRDGTLAAAGEIRSRRGKWRAGEVKSPGNRPAPRGARKAVQEAAAMYEEVQQGGASGKTGT